MTISGVAKEELHLLQMQADAMQCLCEKCVTIRMVLDHRHILRKT